MESDSKSFSHTPEENFFHMAKEIYSLCAKYKATIIVKDDCFEFVFRDGADGKGKVLGKFAFGKQIDAFGMKDFIESSLKE